MYLEDGAGTNSGRPLAFIQHLGRMLSRCPTNSTGRHHRDQTPKQPEGPPPDVASSSSGGNPVTLEPIAANQLWHLEQEIQPYEAVTTEDFMDQAAEQTRRWQAADTTSSSQASRRDLGDSPAPASCLINMCLQCEVKPGTDWPLGLLCKECYEDLFIVRLARVRETKNNSACASHHTNQEDIWQGYGVI